MNNKTALKLFCDYYKTFCNQKICGLIDLNFNVLLSNDLCNAFCNVDTIPAGTSFFELYKDLPSDKLLEIKKLLTQAIETKHKSSFISANLSRKTEYIVALIEYEPIINQYTGDVIAIMISATINELPLLYFKLEHLVQKNILQSSNKIMNLLPNFNLTVFEHEIAFLLFQAENYEEVSMILSVIKGVNISKSLIAKTIREKLFVKFQVYNLVSLKKILHKHGYHKLTPPTLINESIILVRDL